MLVTFHERGRPFPYTHRVASPRASMCALSGNVTTGHTLAETIIPARARPQPRGPRGHNLGAPDLHSSASAAQCARDLSDPNLGAPRAGDPNLGAPRGATPT